VMTLAQQVIAELIVDTAKGLTSAGQAQPS
jgi:hypothetical protein